MASHIASMPGSGIRRVTELAWSTPGAVVLSLGEPDMPTPRHVLDAAVDALDRDDTRYTPNGGIPALRAALARRLRTAHGVEVPPERVWVTAGGAQALHLALTLTLHAGDEVLVPDPGYSTFPMVTHVLQGVPVPYRLLPAHGFVPDPEAIEAQIGPRTRVLLLNSPSNPLGTVLDEAVVAGLVDLARRHDLWIVSDECYEAFTYDVPHVPAARFDTDGRVITLHTFSKTYAMTGMRVGALVVPDALVPRMAAVQESIVSCVNSPAQYAALAALEGPQDTVEEAARTYRHHRDLATELLDAAGIPWLPARGGIYLWADVRHLCGDDVEAWAARLVTDHGVALAPGSAFGPGGEGWVRISLAAGAEDLRVGLGRIPRGRRAPHHRGSDREPLC
ncbi:pyridoxal phosphate-dependent aminotransferase [Georgenia alba]|uniref:Pyridoxal phosphate-dependent aminotransferase n=1 Tax=Georgenia alba TaxID=2233858 RepID=A0ABW2Q3Q8_9MICO